MSIWCAFNSGKYKLMTLVKIPHIIQQKSLQQTHTQKHGKVKISREKEWWFCNMDSVNYFVAMVSSIWNGICEHKGELSMSLHSWMIPNKQHNPLVLIPSSSICSNWTFLDHFSYTHIPLSATLLTPFLC